MSKFAKPKAHAPLPEEEQKAAAIIRRGGDVPSKQVHNGVGEEEKKVQLRLKDNLIDDIDGTRSTRRPKPSRHSWILEAIYEKLEREKELA